MIWFRRVSIAFGSALLLLVVIPFLLCAWLIFTAPGTQWAVRQVLPYVPAEISFARLDGSLWSGLVLSEVAVQPKDGALGFESFVAGEVSFSWQVLSLISGRIHIDHIAIEKADIILLPQTAADPDRSAQAVEFPVIDLPFSLEVESFRLVDVRIVSEAKHEKLPDLDAHFWLGGNQVILSKLDLTYEDINYEFSGRARLSKTAAFSVKVPSHGISAVGECSDGTELKCSVELAWKAFSHTITGDMQSPNGNLTVALIGDHLALKGKGDFIWPYEFAPIDTSIEISGNVDLAADKAQIESFSAAFAGGSVRAHGELNWEHIFGLNLEVSAENVSLAQWLPAELEESKASLQGNLSLSAPEAGVRLKVQVPAINLNFGAKPLTGGFNLSLDEQSLKFSDLLFTSAGSKISGVGFLGLDDTFGLDASFESAELKNLVPELAGKANARINAKGNVNAPAVKLAVDAESLHFFDFMTQVLRFELDLSVAENGQNSASVKSSRGIVDLLKAVHINKFDGHVEALTAADVHIARANLSLAGNLEKHKIELVGDGLLGQFDLNNLEIDGAVHFVDGDDLLAVIAASSWRAELQKLVLTDYLHSSSWNLKSPSSGQISADQLEWQPICLSRATLSLCFNKLTLKEWHKLSVAGELSGFYLDRQRALFSSWYEQLPVEWELHGELVGRWQLDADFGADAIEKLVLSAQVESVNAKMRYTEDNEPSLELPIEKFLMGVSGDENKLTLIGDIQFDKNQRLALQGAAQQWQAADRSLTLNVKGDLGNLAYLQPFISGQRNLVGAAQVDISLAVPKGKSQIEYQGGIVVSDAGVSLPATGTQLSGWQLVLEAERGDLVLHANGKVGDGLARIEGKVVAEVLNDEKVFQAELAISGKDIYLVNLPDVQLTADPSLKFSGNGLRWHLSGDVRVHHSSMTLKELPVSASSVSEDAVVYGRAESESKAGLVEFTSDVVLGFDKAVTFEGFGLTTEVGGELRFTRDETRLNQAHGIVFLTNGRFRSYGQKLDIETGQIIFSGPIDNPALSVLAIRKIDDVTVGVQLAGNAKHPKTTLYSNKSMSEADILSYMVSGKPISQSGAGDVVDMQSAALGLGLKQALPLLQRIGGEFGISDISVEEASDGGSSIAAGRRITDKLYVKYVYGLLGAAGNFVVQYKLSEQLGIETTSGDSQAIDLTYRWESKPPNTKTKPPVSDSQPAD